MTEEGNEISGLRDDEWEKIKDSVPGREIQGEQPLIVAGLLSVIWIARNRAPWRTLLEIYGNSQAFTNVSSDGLRRASGKGSLMIEGVDLQKLLADKGYDALIMWEKIKPLSHQDF